jgi:NTE family protein
MTGKVVRSIIKMSKTGKQRVGVALSGGSALGIAHIGVLQSLRDHDIPIDCIAGTSAGAIVAACYAFGVPMEKVTETARKLSWYNIPKLSFSGLGLFSHAALAKFIEEFLKDAKIEDATIPLSIVAADLETGERVIFRKGSLIKALTASASIPGFFIPVEVGGHLLVDGGLVDNLPFFALSEMGATTKVGVNVNRWISRRQPKNLLDVATRSMEIAITYRHPLAKNEILIEPHLEGFTPSDFSKAEGLVRAGYQAASLSIKEIRTMAGKRIPRVSWWENFRNWFDE